MSKKKVLIVEDEVITAMEIKNCLINIGCKVIGIVTSGERAIEKVSNNGINLILMDINLNGEIDGIEATEIIHSKFGTPVIFLTAYEEKEKTIRAKFSFPFGFLSKPFNDEELKAAIEKF